MEQSYSFHLLEKSIYSSIDSRDFQEKLRKWGLLPHMSLWKYRFDLPYNEFSPESFLIDLINSPQISSVIQPIQSGKKAERVTEISFKELKAQETSMDYFNFLQEKEIVSPNGSIKKIIPDYYEDIEICDKIREVLLIEESEDYSLIEESYRNEFLFRIFQHVCIGGGICQYEDEVSEYLDVTKGIYKDLISVTKDNESQELRVLSKVYQLLPTAQFAVFYNPHPQDFCYVIVDPSFRHVNIWYHKWTGIWQ
jgi:cilia- and flagella-associated protein 300